MIKVTPDGLVDVSQFLEVGQNVIEITQRRDMSRYTFVLHVHSPTPSQLEEVVRRRLKEKSWHDWLRKMSRPLNMPLGGEGLSC